ncbi:MAG: HlyD family efflux transporter periplasmic adaptor subunit [Dokdonella sp.]|uniref:HlyD family secretion protein n=1 Tax=Dokdonella sp. TaxID=2291710 RepID=UPI003264D31E
MTRDHACSAARWAATFLLASALAACSKATPEPALSGAAATPWLAMARGQVDVEGGLVRVVAARDGRVASVAVEDGDALKAGDVLAMLDDRQARIGVGIAEASVAQAQAQVDVLKARLHPASVQAGRIAEAAGAGAATGQSSDDASAALAVLKAEIRAGEANVKLASEHVSAAKADLDAQSIRAPAAGRIVRRSVHVGDVVSVQLASELFQLLPERPRIVRAELNEAYVDLVKPGMQAEVVRDSDQGTPVMARVLRVGEVFGPSRLTDDPVERAGAHDVECVLQLDNSPFRIGQRVLVRFKR